MTRKRATDRKRRLFGKYVLKRVDDRKPIKINPIHGEYVPVDYCDQATTFEQEKDAIEAARKSRRFAVYIWKIGCTMADDAED